MHAADLGSSVPDALSTLHLYLGVLVYAWTFMPASPAPEPWPGVCSCTTLLEELGKNTGQALRTPRRLKYFVSCDCCCSF